MGDLGHQADIVLSEYVSVFLVSWFYFNFSENLIRFCSIIIHYSQDLLKLAKNSKSIIPVVYLAENWRLLQFVSLVMSFTSSD